MNWPDNADGNVFRSLEQKNFDFSKKHVIDFNIDFETWPLGEDVIYELKQQYPNMEIVEPDEEDLKDGIDVGFIQFQLEDYLTYDFVIRIQKETTEFSNKFGGYCDSWGVLSNWCITKFSNRQYSHTNFYSLNHLCVNFSLNKITAARMRLKTNVILQS